MTRIIRFPGSMDVAADWPTLIAAEIADGFNRTDSVSLGSTPVGGKTWTNATGAAIVNNNLDFSAVASTSNVRFTSGWANYEFEARLSAIGASPATTAGGILARYVDASNYYWLSTRISPSGLGVQFWQTAAGVPSLVGTGTTVTLRPGDVLKVVASGSVLTGYLNGVVVAKVTGVASASTVVGFLAHASGTATKWDYIQGRQL